MPEPKRPLKVFLSYASQDKPLVRELSRRLTGEGWIDTWQDEKSLLPGQDWRVKIEEAVEEADVVIICLSNYSVSKEGHVQKELRYAREIALEKPEDSIFLIPLRLDECEVPRGLRFYQWVDYFGEKKDESYRALISSLKLRYEQKLKLEKAERLRKEQIQREAAEKIAREKAEKEAAEKERLKAEEVERQRIAREKAEREAAERDATERARLQAEEEARQKAVKEKADREMAERIEREGIARTTRERLDREAVKIKQQLPKVEESRLVVTQKLPRKWKSQMFATIAGVIIILTVMLGLPWGQWFAVATKINATPTNTISFTPPQPTETRTPAPSKTPTEVFALNATPFPEEITDSKGVTMHLVPAGEFTMGSEDGALDERLVHQVDLNAFYIDIYEVTNAAYRACVNASICGLPKPADRYNNSKYKNHPVVYVDWYMAKAYCEWRGGSLPTEAQWEKASRGTDGRTYPWGEENDCEKANYNNCKRDTIAVGSYESGKSPYGIYDLAGNVWEWVADWYSETYYENSPSENPLGPNSGQYRVLRGGSWYDYSFSVRSATRGYEYPVFINNYVGFRCARDAYP